MKFLILDGAQCGDNLSDALAQASHSMSLYKGRSEENLASVAPYHIDLEKRDDKHFEQWFLENGWGASWGIIIESELPFGGIYQHFRKFLMVETEEFTPLYFRFYDPRVLRLFLPTCDAGQLKEFFGPVDRLICEDKDINYVLLFSILNGKLDTKRVKLNEYFAESKKPMAVATVEPLLDAQIPNEKREEDSPVSEPQKKLRRFIY